VVAVRGMETVEAAWLRQIDAASARDRILIAARRGLAMDAGDTPDKVAALLDTARALDEIGASYALIGGVAVGIHAGVPRATVDTDVAVITSKERADIVEAMTAAGFRLVGEFEHSVNLRHASGEPVQLAFDPSFDAMIERAETIIVSATPVRIIRKADLIRMKLHAASDPARRKSKALRDQADVELLLGDVPDPDEGW
jgi:hypothetical protein